MQHLNGDSTCRNVCNGKFFEIIDHALSYFRLNLME